MSWSIFSLLIEQLSQPWGGVIIPQAYVRHNVRDHEVTLVCSVPIILHSSYVLLTVDLMQKQWQNGKGNKGEAEQKGEWTQGWRSQSNRSFPPAVSPHWHSPSEGRGLAKNLVLTSAKTPSFQLLFFHKVLCDINFQAVTKIKA